MSPDPPRDHTDPEDNPLHMEEVYFMPIEDDDDEFILDEDGPHELDYSDHENEDTEFSDDEERQPANAATNPTGNAQGRPRLMARYQMLIQMPHGETVDTSAAEESEELPSENQSSSVTTISSTQPEEENKEKEEMKKREIDLSDNQVELIKNAMKGFSLPSANIPKWVEEIDESSWKETLVSTIHKKTSIAVPVLSRVSQADQSATSSES